MLSFAYLFVGCVPVMSDSKFAVIFAPFVAILWFWKLIIQGYLFNCAISSSFLSSKLVAQASMTSSE